MRRQFHRETVLDWVRQQADALDNGYMIFSTDRALFMTECRDEEIEKTVAFADALQDRILHDLPSLAAGIPPAKLVFLQFEDRELYVAYSARFRAGGQFGASGAMAIRAGYPHIAMLPGALPELKPILAHEVLHVLAASMDLPLWFEEGLAHRMESLSDEMVWRPDTKARSGRAHRVWDEDTIQGFWSGASFFTPGEFQEASYGLAADLHDLLAANGPAFDRFVLEARAFDAGDSASRTCFGEGLGPAVSALLGPGNWAPRPPSAGLSVPDEKGGPPLWDGIPPPFNDTASSTVSVED